MSTEEMVVLSLCACAVILMVLLILIDYIKEEINKRK